MLLASIAILGLSCCVTNKTISDHDAIFNVKWYLVKYVDTDNATEEDAFETIKDIPLKSDDICWFIFTTDTLCYVGPKIPNANVYRGYGVCNRFERYYKVNTKKKEIQFVSPFMTEIGFRGEIGMKVNKVEERFIDSFRNITNYKLEGDTLLLYYDDGKKYVQFQKKRIK
jgi:hypothetical protein